MNSLAAQRLHHAYLFAGTRGVGKTTVARILAKALNCAEGIVAEPCGVCDACIAIDEGRFVDLIEVDAASRTKVDDTREMLENVQYTPSRGRFKVYLIDEVHMLSSHSFNALLKTLEEPPPHVKFLLATTDPQKLPVTVLSRCLQFNLKKIPAADIQAHLHGICAEEGVTTEQEGLRTLAAAADGSVRDALSLLDQAIAFTGGNVTSQSVDSMLGTIDRDHVRRILEALASGDGSALLSEVVDLDQSAPDYGAALDDIMSWLQRIAVAQLVGRGAVDEALPDVQTLSESISPEDVQLYYQIALQGRRDLSVCRDPRVGFEMTLLRMLAFRPADEGRSEARRKVTKRDEPTAAQPDLPPPAEDSREPAHTPTQAPTGIPDWERLLQAADVTGAARQLAEHCAMKQAGERRLELVMSQENVHLNTQQVRTRLESALSEHLGRPISLSIATGEPPAATPAQIRKAGENERMRKAREAIEQDPNVKAVQSAFDAVLEADSIQPVDD